MYPSDNIHPDTEGLTIIYDGECPFCRNYVHMLKLRQAAGSVTLLNARDGGELVDSVWKMGLDLNEGMALHYGGGWYHGAECMHILSLLTSPYGIFNRITAWVFRSPRRARLLYPILRSGRNLTLRLLGKHKISQ